MKKRVVLFVCLVLFISLGADTIYDNIESTVRRCLTEFRNNSRDIPLAYRDYFPLTYAMVMNTREYGPANMIIQEWVEDDWQDLMEWDFYYDTDGLITSYDQYYYGPGYTVIYYYFDITYDDQDRVTEMWMDLDMMGTLVDGSHEIFEYGDDWLDYWIIEGDYGVGSYVNQEQAYFTYSNGELSETLYQHWLEDTSAWEDDYRHTLTYDAGLLATVLYEYYEESQWMNEYFLTYTMIDDSTPSEILEEIWDGGTFVNHERDTFSYMRDLYDERLSENWENSAWVNSKFEEVTVNEDGNPIEIYVYEWDGTDWVDYQRYFYEYGPSGVDPNSIEPFSTEISNYPNPFNPETTIEFNITVGNLGILEIFNLKGQIIYSQEFVSGDHTYIWNAADQSSGIYFYKVTSGEFEQTNKMILMK